MQAQAAAEAQALRDKLEGRIAAIAGRLGQLASQEEARERRRQELAAQVRAALAMWWGRGSLDMLVEGPA